MTRIGFVMDLDRCSGCQSCEVACKYENGLALGEYWSKVITVGPMGTYPDIQMYWLPVNCQQCENPPCIDVCPTGASYRDSENGLVLVDKDTCIGCKSCLGACPYNVRQFNEEKQLVEKCTTCFHLDEPLCVRNCPGACRFIGDLDDPSSEVSKILAAADPSTIHQLSDSGNGPSTYYLLSPKYAQWQEIL